MTTASIHTLASRKLAPRKSVLAITVDPDLRRLGSDDHARLLQLWRRLVKGHFLDPKALAGQVLDRWLPNLLVSRRLNGPLRFDVTLCGHAVTSAISRSAKGRLVHDLIAERALPHSLFTGLQQCIDRACPIHQIIDADRGAEALHLPVGQTGRLPSHILTHFAGLDGGLNGGLDRDAPDQDRQRAA